MTNNAKFNGMRARDFFREHPLVSMVNLAGGGGGARVIKGDPAASQASVGSASRILYANIQGVTNYQNLNLVWTHVCCQPVKVTIGGAVGIPFFHLPYNNNQNFRVTLTDRQAIGNVNLFLTEFVDGCSVYVEGTPQAPTVYHINAVGTQRAWSVWSPFRVTAGLRRAADWSAKYNRMDQRFKTDKQKPKSVRNAVAGLSPATKVENHDYMLNTAQETNVVGQLATFQGASKVPAMHNGNSVDRISVIASQGSVFGERNPATGDWKFYIQKRVLVAHYHDGMAAPLDYQWLILSVDQFWPTAKTGRLVA